MRVSNRSCAWAVAAAVLGPAAAAPAAVSLSITDTSGPSPTSETVNPGTTGTAVSFILNLVTTANEQTTAANYFMRVGSQQVDLTNTQFFRIAGRDLTGTVYPLVYNQDVVTPPASLLNPENDQDLGGSVANQNAPTPAVSGTYRVASYSIAVAASTPQGTYTLTTFSLPGFGYAGPGPNFDDFSFAQHATYQIVVVPEPAGLGLAGLAAVGLLARRRATAAR